MNTLAFVTRHTPTPAQQAAAAQLGFVLRQVDVHLPESREDLADALAQAGVATGAPVALVAPVHIVEAVRRLGHPVIIFGAPQRGATIDGTTPVQTSLLCGLRSLSWDGPSGPASEEVWPTGWWNHPWAIQG